MVSITLSLIDEIGVAAVTMEEIAARANIAKITLYRRWPSRLALLVDALLVRFHEVAPLDEGLAPRVAMVRHFNALAVALNGKLGEQLHVIIAECQSDPAMRLVFRDQYIGLRRQIAIRIIAKGLSIGDFHSQATAEQCHDALYGTIFYRFLFEIGRISQRSIMDIFESILGAPGAKPKEKGSLLQATSRRKSR